MVSIPAMTLKHFRTRPTAQVVVSLTANPTLVQLTNGLLPLCNLNGTGYAWYVVDKIVLVYVNMFPDCSCYFVVISFSVSILVLA